MKVVVAGGMGFLGTNVCDMYSDAGEEVIAIDNLTKFELRRNWYDADRVRDYNLNHAREKGTSFVKDTIVDGKSIETICKDADYIINCAAQPAMTIAITNPVLDYETNLTGLVNLLEISRKYDKPFAHCSSIHVFGNNLNKELGGDGSRFTRQAGAIAEDHKLLDGEITPLHASKRAGEIYIQAYIDTYGLDAICLRLTGIYGPQQFGGEEHGWVANFAIRTLMKKHISIFGTDRQVRDILYVDDAVKVFDAFYKNQRPGIYNVGGGKKCIISIQECIKMLYEITHNRQFIQMKKKRKGDLWWFVTDNKKVSDALGWKPKVIPNEGILHLMDWIKTNRRLFI